MTKDDIEVLLEGLIECMTDDGMTEHRFTERQIELIRAFKLGWLKHVPDPEVQHD